MQTQLRKIYEACHALPGKENISLTLTLKADNLLTQIESALYPSISNEGCSIVLSYGDMDDRCLKIYISEKEVKGTYYENWEYKEEYCYLDVNKVQTLITRHGF